MFPSSEQAAFGGIKFNLLPRARWFKWFGDMANKPEVATTRKAVFPSLRDLSAGNLDGSSAVPWQTSSRLAVSHTYLHFGVDEIWGRT